MAVTEYTKRYLRNQDTFIELYDSFYPEDTSNGFSSFKADLLKKYQNFFSWYYVMADGYQEGDENLGEDIYISMWLLFDLPTEHLNEKLFSVIAIDPEIRLTPTDHAVMIYVSYQDEETQALLKGLPLSFLHDTFDAIARENFTKWLLE
jgi:hypothetical protein